MRSLLHRLFDRPGTRAFDAAGAHRQMHHDQINAEHAAKSAIAAERLRPWTAQPPPRHGSSLAQNVWGGAQRGASLAKVDFVGEATWNPLGKKTVITAAISMV